MTNQSIPPNARLPLYYTFGNHMHWVDMAWLWGYHVLPGSVRDMLHFCAATGVKGNVNFDGQLFVADAVDLHPYEVCTLYLDLVEGRKQTRDLDSRRSVWATAHWVSKEG